MSNTTGLLSFSNPAFFMALLKHGIIYFRDSFRLSQFFVQARDMSWLAWL